MGGALGNVRQLATYASIDS